VEKQPPVSATSLPPRGPVVHRSVPQHQPAAAAKRKYTVALAVVVEKDTVALAVVVVKKPQARCLKEPVQLPLPPLRAYDLGEHECCGRSD
jgi:hypothetical protein